MSTIYSELLAAASADDSFLHQAEGEPDTHYIRRLVLAVSKCSDQTWEALSIYACDWYNTQAIRVKKRQDPEECPGYGGSFAQVDKVDVFTTGMEAGICPVCKSEETERLGSTSTWPNICKKCEARFNSKGDVYKEKVDPIVDSVVDAGWPLNPKHTATDAVRALVMQHQDWNQSQIAAELEAHGQPVSLGTIATVRSMTLATIAVAKGLGKWVEG